MERKEKFEELFSNYENGNISVFHRECKKLSKLELIDFIYFIMDQHSDRYTIQEVCSILYKALMR